MDSIAERLLRMPYYQACREVDQLCIDFNFYADRYALWAFSDGSSLKAYQAKNQLYSVTDVE